MDFYTCPVCNNQVSNNDRERHEMMCNNAFREDEFIDMIPCEICGRLVNYENYSEHINSCYSFTGISDNINFSEQLDSAINNLQNMVNNTDNVNLIDDNDDNDGNDGNDDNDDNENMDIGNDNDLPPLINNDATNVMNMFMNIINSGITPNNIVINPEIDDYTQLTNLSETIGNVEIGIEDPDMYFKKTINIGFKCPICYNICENTMITSCNHEICADCTKEWYSKNKKCVICMNEIKKL